MTGRQEGIWQDERQTEDPRWIYDRFFGNFLLLFSVLSSERCPWFVVFRSGSLGSGYFWRLSDPDLLLSYGYGSVLFALEYGMTGVGLRLLQKLSTWSELVIQHFVGILSYCFQYYRVSGVPDSQYSGQDYLNPAIFDAIRIRIRPFCSWT